GNAVAAATAMAVLEVIQNEGLQANAQTVGSYFCDGLQDLATRHHGIGDVRAAGLFLGVEMVTDRATMAPDAARTNHIVNALRQARILISATGPRANILKIRPPLVFSKANVDLFIDRFDAVLKTQP
ncbi:MAG: aminotransferase class III-fold pyridoxal phosphate-dependent enzyme, partial [Paracoccaceae bacterium]